MGVFISRLAVVVAVANTIVACAPGGAPSNVMIHVANESSTAGQFEWLSPGLFGSGIFRSTERETIGGCAVFTTGLGPGSQTVTITLDSNS